MQTYIYTTSNQLTNKPIAGVIKARHAFEALHNARFIALERNGNPRFISLKNITN